MLDIADIKANVDSHLSSLLVNRLSGFSEILLKSAAKWLLTAFQVFRANCEKAGQPTGRGGSILPF
jgi:hypothetical protein